MSAIPSPLTHCFIDIEVDGPTPGVNSLLSLGMVACDRDGWEIDTFECNFQQLQSAQEAPDVMRWWKTQPEAWNYIRTNTVPVEYGVKRLFAWLTSLQAPRLLAARPIIFDALWLDWHLQKYSGARVFDGPFSGQNLFAGACIDIPSYVQAALGMPYQFTRPDYPKELLDGVPHTHRPVDDARGHAALYFNARRKVLKPDQ